MSETANRELFVNVLAHIEIEQHHCISTGSDEISRWEQGTWLMAAVPAEDVPLREDQKNALEKGGYLELDDLPVPAEIVPDCGTAGCFAGWACLLSGVKMKWTCSEVADDYAVLSASVDEPGMEFFSVARKAEELLGAREGTYPEGGWFDLFSAGNDLNTLYTESAALLGIEEDELRRLVEARHAELFPIGPVDAAD